MRAIAAELLLLIWGAALCMGADPPARPNPSREEMIAELMERTDQLEARLTVLDREQREVRQALGELQTLRARLAAAPAAPAAAPAAPVVPIVPTQSAAPLYFRIGAAEFTPGGFLDMASVYRSTNVGSGIGTAFGSLPFAGAPAGQLPESRFSAQNSRISLKVASRPGNLDLTGYVEADFLGMQPGNTYVSSNGNTMRMRLYWADLRAGKWELLGGQSWSMFTPGRAGISPMPSDLFYTQVIDTNYQVGLTWTRAPQVRLVHHTSRHVSLGLSFENPQQYVGSAVVLPAGFPAATVDNGSNLASPSPRPDIIVKAAYDTSIGGHGLHLESAGLLRGFRVASAAGGRRQSANGTGVSMNLNVAATRNLRLILNTYWSSGGGRYLFGLGPDLIVRPNLTISPVKAQSVLAGWEYQAGAKWMVYGYYGAAYFGRSYASEGNAWVGYGYPGSSVAANRAIQEPSLGVVRTLWKKTEYGALQVSMQYSYVQRNPWCVPASGPAAAHSHMLFQALRYVLP